MNHRKTKRLTSPLKQLFFATVWALDQSWFSNTQTRSSFWRCFGCCHLGKLDFNTGRRLSRGLLSSGFRSSKASNHTSKNSCCSLPSVFGLCHHQLQEQFHSATVPAQNRMPELYFHSQNPGKVQQEIMIN